MRTRRSCRGASPISAYSIDEATHVLTVNIEGSTFPNFTDGTQTRILSFEGDEVTYFNPTPSMGGSAKVTYRRAK